MVVVVYVEDVIVDVGYVVEYCVQLWMQQWQCQGFVVGGDDEGKLFVGYGWIVCCWYVFGLLFVNCRVRFSFLIDRMYYLVGVFGVGFMWFVVVYMVQVLLYCSDVVLVISWLGVCFWLGLVGQYFCFRIFVLLFVCYIYYY